MTIERIVVSAHILVAAFTLLATLLGLAGGTCAREPRQDDDPKGTRTTFLISRPPPGQPRAHIPGPRQRRRARTLAEMHSVAPLGLAYTIFQNGADGVPIRVDPSNVFHAGDQVCVVLESNADGYLYVFTT